MAGCVLELEEELWSWRADTLQSDENDRARAALRAMVVELGQLARHGTRDPAEVLGPYVELLLAQRDLARRARRFDEADAIRDRLVQLGVEVRDSPEGTTWELQTTRSPEGVA
jgi:cysteinyl-tRNA synthetase